MFFDVIINICIAFKMHLTKCQSLCKCLKVVVYVIFNKYSAYYKAFEFLLFNGFLIDKYFFGKK